MADLYVVAGVKQEESYRRLMKDGVADSAKSLGKMHSAELAPTSTPQLALWR